MASPPAVTPPLTLETAPPEEFHALLEQRLERPVAVREPLVLISQIQRSGGTLLSQLLDAHPQLHAHPHELHIGYPRDKRDWPQLDLSRGPEEWFRALREAHVDRMLVGGYRKYARKWVQYADERLETYPFLLIPSLQRRLFERCAGSWPIERQRDVLDAYMTSYFNAWVDNRNLYGDKLWVTGFSARLAVPRDNRRRFFNDYPDGRLMSIVREPRSWYASAVAYNADRYGNLKASVERWRESAEAMIEAKERYGDRVLLITFERLLKELEPTMERIASFLGIDFEPTLLEPTFNGLPIKANSSFRTDRHGVLDAPLKRQEGLGRGDLETIERLAADTYQRVLPLTA
jgi:hypothetical protein